MYLCFAKKKQPESSRVPQSSLALEIPFEISPSLPRGITPTTRYPQVASPLRRTLALSRPSPNSFNPFGTPNSLQKNLVIMPASRRGSGSVTLPSGQTLTVHTRTQDEEDLPHATEKCVRICSAHLPSS